MSIQATSDANYPYKRRYRDPKGESRHGKRRMQATFPVGLWKQIDDEAKQRGWPFARMIVHLCEASIEGIE